MGDALAPWHIIILVIVLVLFFGARRLPGAAKSLGESMHIFKRSVQGLHPDEQDSAANPGAAYSGGTYSAAQPVSGTLPPPAATPTLAAPPDATAQQLSDLQAQIADLRRQQTEGAGQPAPTEPAQPR